MKNTHYTLPSPCWLLEEAKLLKNLTLISEIKKDHPDVIAALFPDLNHLD